jgi:hypothetical protein
LIGRSVFSQRIVLRQQGRPIADFGTSLQRCSAAFALLTLMHRAAFVEPSSVCKSKDQQPR